MGILGIWSKSVNSNGLIKELEGKDDDKDEL
jgi:hypothetical protein